MEVRYSGDLKRKLEQLKENSQSLQEQQTVPLTELLPDSLIRRYTDFNSLQEMVDASGLDQAEEIGGDAWRSFVAKHSRLDWEGLLQEGTGEWVKRKLGL